MASNSDKLRYGMISVLVANIINLVINVLTSFILPKYLSVDSYAAIKTYNLYIAYIGVLSLGYVDGMFLKYGGIELRSLDKDDLSTNVNTFRIFQLFVVLILFATGLLWGDYIFLAFIASTLPTNMIGYFRSFYQSTGEFKGYSRIMNITTGATFIINVVLIFVFKIDNYKMYLALYVLLNVIIWLLLEIYFVKIINCKHSFLSFSIKEIIENVKRGILLMMGNFSNIILTSMDRWFIKFLMDTMAFAQYSFACSMENFINVAVTPLTVTLYNYFCKIKDIDQIRKIRNITILFGSALISSAFVGKFVLEVYLKQYLDASKVMFYLFAAQFFYLIIKSIYVNLYKAFQMQTKYFIKLIIVIVVGIFFNIICYWIYPFKESFAVGTLLSSFVWLILSSMDFKEVLYSVKEVIFMTIVILSFLILGNSVSSIIGFVSYVFIILMAANFLMKEALNYIKSFIQGYFVR